MVKVLAVAVLLVVTCVPMVLKLVLERNKFGRWNISRVNRALDTRIAFNSTKKTCSPTTTTPTTDQLRSILSHTHELDWKNSKKRSMVYGPSFPHDTDLKG